MMETRKESLSERISKLTRKYRELQKNYRMAIEEIDRLKRENESLREKLSAALRELEEASRALDAILGEFDE